MKKVFAAIGAVFLASHAWADGVIIKGNTTFDANYPEAYSGQSGSPAGFTVGGAASDPNAGLELKAKGSGIVSIPSPATVGGTLGVTGAATFSGTVSNITTTDDYLVTPPVYWNIKQATLTPSANTSNVWQNDNSYVYLQGPGQNNGEINLRHTNFNVAVGAYATQAEDHEIQMGNAGTIVAWNGDLFIPTNLSTGIVTGNLFNSKYQLTNNNTTAGAIAEYAAIDNESMQGGGSTPSYYYFIRDADPKGLSAFSGPMVIGSLSAPGTGTLFQVVGTDTSGGTYPVNITNSAGLNMLLMADSGQIQTSGPILLGAKGQTNYVTIAGVATGLAPEVKASGSDTNVSLNLQTQGSGALQVNSLLLASAAAVINYPSSTTGAGTQTFTNSPCTGLTTEKWVPITITGQTGTFYVPACQ